MIDVKGAYSNIPAVETAGFKMINAWKTQILNTEFSGQFLLIFLNPKLRQMVVQMLVEQIIPLRFC